ncbi:MAG: LytTR family transcriptional regulator DNA-binding domain-containing protein [Cyclobacteriaceae bacterium]|nr:LytTR family transcriptional regulator DNA-binding domain-containing protein [Cyclobacteriaceae bacterium]
MEIQKNPYHPDVTVFLILIPFISAINYYLTYVDIKLNGFLVLTFTIDTLQGYCGWWGARTFIFYLDKRLPFDPNPGKRIALQLTGTTLIGLFIISILTEVVSLVAKGKMAPSEFYLFDLFIIWIWFFVVNGIYLGLYFYGRYQESETQRQREKRIKTEGLFVKQGKQEIRLDYKNLEGLFVDGDYAVASQPDGKKFYLAQSLDKIEKLLPEEFFFRLSRQYLIHRQFITGFKRAENGKVQVQLKTSSNFPSEIVVSRLRAPAFKSWFQPD